jgi:hemerythrin-like domain-containing protein
MQTPTAILRCEHALILRALDALEAAAERLERGEPALEWWWSQLLDWLRTFADRTHHAKEEGALFPAMTRAGVPDEGGPIGTMLTEHSRGRDLIAAMASSAGRQRAAAARDYAALLREHILKENEVLFPMADAVLDGPVQQGLTREFAAVAAGSLAYAEGVLDGLAAVLAPAAPPG